MVLLLSGWENINKKFTKQQVLLRQGSLKTGRAWLRLGLGWDKTADFAVRLCFQAASVRTVQGSLKT